MSNFIAFSDSKAVSAEYKALLKDELAQLARDYKVGTAACLLAFICLLM
jgi:hypothetical protein